MAQNSVYAYIGDDDFRQFIAEQDLALRGSWSSGSSYAPFEVVDYLAAQFVALQANSGQTPPIADRKDDFWSILVLVLEQAGTDDTSPAYLIASEAYTLATAGTEVANEALGLAQEALTVAIAGTDAATAIDIGNLPGTGAGLAGTRSGDDLLLKRLEGGNNVTVTEAADHVQIAVETITTNLTGWLGPAMGSYEQLSYAGTVTIDFNGSAYQEIDLTGDLTLIFTGMDLFGQRENVPGISVILRGDASDRNLAFDDNVVFLGTKPTALTANTTAVVSFTAFGTTAADIIAAYAAQQ